MAKHTRTVAAPNAAPHGTLQSYAAGFIISLTLTIAAYMVVVHDVFSGWILVAAIVVLAFAQLIAQLIFFLHLGRQSRWSVVVFLFMVLVVGILVIGSLWIMNNLHYNMSPHEMDEYMLHQSQKGF